MMHHKRVGYACPARTRSELHQQRKRGRQTSDVVISDVSMQAKSSLSDAQMPGQLRTSEGAIMEVEMRSKLYIATLGQK